MKFWLIIAGSFLIFGLIMFVIVMSINGWDFSKLGASKFVTNTHEIDSRFDSLSIDTDTADIYILPSTDGACRVEAYEMENAKHSVSVKDGTLFVEINDERAWYEELNFNTDSPKITVYMPFTELDALVIKECTGDIEISKNFTLKSVDISVTTGDVKCYASAKDSIKIEATTGNIFVKDVTSSSIDISLTTGDITLIDVQCSGDIGTKLTTGMSKMKNVQCKNLVSKGSTGDLELENVLCQEKLYAKRKTGDIELDGCDGGEIEFDLTTGDVEGTLLSDKVFITRTSTGDIDVPESITGGKCKITTTTGDINIKIKK